jgi:arylformamidase
VLASKPLFSLEREGCEEVCVYGEIVAVGAAGVLFRSGEASSRVPARSLLKPLQLQATGWVDAESEIEPCRVPALGSISATFPQFSELLRWHEKNAVRAQLLLGPTLPLDDDHRVRVLEAGTGPSQYFHPCFSKHMAILDACRAQGWPLDGYASKSHPFHAELLRVLSPYLDHGSEPLQFLVDGCQLPTPLLSAVELARIYRHLAVTANGSVEARIRQAMQGHPAWIGASERFDTRLMLQNPGRLIAKEGADGLLAIGIGPTRAEPGGVGLLIKLASGHQPAWAALAAAPFLSHLGLTPVRDATPGQEVVWHAHPTRTVTQVWDISPALSERTAVWPGDTPYRRELLTELGKPSSASGPSWELTISSIHTTVHIGAHADAPNHFSATGRGIDAVPLTPYRGVCQVIDVRKEPGSLIFPADLADMRLSAPRLLFKTGSFPDPEQFNPDFLAFSPELVAWLEARGTILLGIDTPSVDPFSSKELPTHHATRQGHGISILEGLDLSEVTAGLYELVALPLRLRDADASPVRATLWPLR